MIIVICFEIVKKIFLYFILLLLPINRGVSNK